VVWNLEAVSLVELASAIHLTKGLLFRDSRPLNQSEAAKFLSAQFNFDTVISAPVSTKPKTERRNPLLG
jgi:hypothetical protein